ncbi:MAG: hypothetical protein ISS27_03045 [Candidatus Omnitrophica bacterium]|nr:hypothetical protein [Candidatus Omnitrophota bacterium]
MTITSVVLTSKNNSAKPALENTATDISGHRQDKKAIESAPRVIDEIDYSKDTEDGLLLN